MCFLQSTFQTLRWFLAGHGIVNIVLAVAWLAVPILGLVYYLFVYWEANPDCLVARRFWKARKIPWQSVRSVGKLGFTDNVTIFYGHSIDDYGSLIVDPAKRPEFIAALRKFAPQAEFKE